MPLQTKDLGRPISVNVIAPVYIQRAVFIIALSFIFFLGMMFAYYILKNLMYFLLASAFLVIYLFTLFSFILSRRQRVEIFENGLRLKSQSILWDDIDEVGADGSLKLKNRKTLSIPPSINNVESVIGEIRRRATQA